MFRQFIRDLLSRLFSTGAYLDSDATHLDRATYWCIKGVRDPSLFFSAIGRELPKG